MIEYYIIENNELLTFPGLSELKTYLNDKSLQILKERYNKAVKFNFDISITGVKLTQNVVNFIKEKNLQGLKIANNKYYVVDRLKLPSDKTVIKKGNIQIGLKIGSEIYSSAFSYSNTLKVIHINHLDFQDIPKNKVTQYISDALTHEFIHGLLEELFDLTTCLLFDLIEHNFRASALHEEYLNNYNKRHPENIRLTYQQFIKKYSVKDFFDIRLIDEADINQAYIICNKRLKNE